ncbi:MAG: undecaprenyl-phosphate glucose phosphotransferase [Leptospirales bacterium]|nr:undecaprenyl-phosphate glucose phosphotransferase [Leptospirales bacterium]
MLRERSQTFKLAFIAVDLLLAFLSFFAAVLVHFFVISPEKIDLVVPDSGGMFAPGVFLPREFAVVFTYAYLALFMCVAQVIAFIATDLYHPRRGLSFFREFVAILRGVTLSLIVVLALLFFYRGTTFSRAVILYAAAFSVVTHSVGHYFFRKLLERMRARGYNTRSVLVLGTGVSARRFVNSLIKHSIYGYRVIGMIGPAKGLGPLAELHAGNLSNWKKIAQKKNPDVIVYALPYQTDLLHQVIEACDLEGIDCRIIPDMMDLIAAHARIEDLDGVPLFIIRDTPLKNGYNRFMKRAFDMVFAALVLILGSPVFLLLAVLVKLSSPGPVFFKQERVGLDRRIFQLIKFRTMHVQEKSRSDTTWGGKQDARVTALGKLLRKTSLDELPQFLNVLIGNMSVVGPRPERPHFVQKFKASVSHYMRRHSVKSGITGWAQVEGFRGDTSIEKRAEADIYYIENWSFWLDVFIVLKTIPSMIKSPGE